ncbi:MAG: cupin domain-containing protein [Chloroflexota bacterium]
MSIEVFDYRRDLRNVVVTPAIRCRFMRMEPGQVSSLHSHDVGQETFLVLDGEMEFDFEGEKAVAGPGQMVFCPPNVKHVLRNPSPDKPAYFYLSVSPHVEPTHTYYDAEGKRLPPK